MIASSLGGVTEDNDVGRVQGWLGEVVRLAICTLVNQGRGFGKRCFRIDAEADVGRHPLHFVGDAIC